MGKAIPPEPAQPRGGTPPSTFPAGFPSGRSSQGFEAPGSAARTVVPGQRGACGRAVFPTGGPDEGDGVSGTPRG